MKMKTKKILAIILTVAMVLSLLTQSVWAEELSTEPEQAPAAETTFDWTGTGAGDAGIAPMSLLPLEYYDGSVTVDRTEKYPYELADKASGSVYVYEVLKDFLVEKGIMAAEDTEYKGTIVYSTNDNDYVSVGWNDLINETEYSSGNSYYFILGDGDQLNPKNIKIHLWVYVTSYISAGVTIDRTENIPEEVINEPAGTVLISELIDDVLLEKGLITAESPKYNGTIKLHYKGYGFYQGEYGYYDYWQEVTQEDTTVVTLSGTQSFEFTVDDGLKTDTSFKRIKVTANYTDIAADFLDGVEAEFFGKDNRPIDSKFDYYFTVRGYNNIYHRGKQYLTSSQNVDPDEEVKVSLKLPEGFTSDIRIYAGIFTSASEIDENADITDALTGGEPYRIRKTNSNYLYRNDWAETFTFVITQNGRTVVIPLYLQLTSYNNYVDISSGNNLNTVTVYESPDIYYDTAIGTATFIKNGSFDSLNVTVKGRYYDYIGDDYGFGNGYEYDSVVSAYEGSFASEEEAAAAGAENIASMIFKDEAPYYKLDCTKGEAQTAYILYGGEIVEVQLKTVEFTVIDKYGIVYHCSFRYCIGEVASDDTSFNVSGALTVKGSDSYSDQLKAYRIRSSDDSYYRNGYRTLFVLGNDNATPVADGTVIYPTFSTDDTTKIFNGLDATGETGTNRQQISGESPVTFTNGQAIQYSAASESGTHLKNYWVTFITPYQGGSKLFVNATNNPDHYDKELNIPVREVFLNSYYNNHHDILFANVGDEDMTGIKVTLSDAKGIELDPYWTVLEDGVKALAPFTSTTYKSYIRDENKHYIYFDGELPNIAKIRLNPVDENFSEISGTLTISADGQEDVVIKLTGIAGTPRIVTDKVYDGVKYVPYSSVIMTNSMYETDAMEFSVIKGKLPNGIKLLPNGELYGIPTEIGDFTFTVQAKYTGTIAKNSGDDYTDSREYVMHIADNTDENVDAVNTDDQGYELTDRVSKYVTIYYTSLDANGLPVIDRVEIDSDLFRSEGSYTGEFRAFYIDGIELAEGVDYTAEEGSTKITVLAETFSHIGISDKDIAHTLAAEFRNEESELKRSAQNVYLDYIEQNNQNPTPGTGGTTPGGTTPGWQNPSAGNTGSQLPSFEAVAVKVKVVDTNGDPVPGLNLELHSVVKYATTGADGTAVFDSVEFGRHILYVMNSALSFGPSKTFTIVSGFGTALDGNILTAEIGQTIELTVEYSGNSLTLLGAKSEVEIPQEGTVQDTDGESSEEKEEEASDSAEPKEEKPSETEPSDNPATGIAFGFAALVLAAVVAVAAKKK